MHHCYPIFDVLQQLDMSKCEITAFLFVCGWFIENLPLTHKYEYWEILTSFNYSKWHISEGLKLQACNLLWIYSYWVAIKLPTPQCTASWISCHFRLLFINTTSTYIFTNQIQPHGGVTTALYYGTWTDQKVPLACVWHEQKQFYCWSCATELCGWFSWWKALGFHAIKPE